MYINLLMLIDTLFHSKEIHSLFYEKIFKGNFFLQGNSLF